MAPLAFLLACDKVPQAGFEPDTGLTLELIVLKKRRAPLPPGGAAAIDEKVDRGVDPQEKVVRTCQAEKIGWRREKPEKERKWGGHPIENLPHLIRFSTMKSSPMMRMTLGKLEMGVPSSPQ